jgi:hypothetical protein
MKRTLSAALTVVCLSLTLPAYAAHPLATDDTGTQGKLKFQVETTAEFGWDKETSNNSTTKSDYQTLNVAVTAGVLDSLDLVLSYPYTWQHSEDNTGTLFDNSGLNDLSLALKWRFLELGPASFALKPSVTFPTASRDRYLGTGRPAYGATLISTVEFKPVAVHANIGYTNQQYTDADKDGSRHHLWNLSLAGSVEVMKGLQLVAEIGTVTNPDTANTTWPTFMTGGVIYSVIENLDVSLGVKGGLTAPETDIALLAGVTFRFP